MEFVARLLRKGCQEQRRDPRRSERGEGVALRIIVADKAGLANGRVIDMTTRGCGLRLETSHTRSVPDAHGVSQRRDLICAM
jgi:hypothetical protein